MTTIKQPALMDKFDVEKHPLSNAVWKELEKLYPNQPRSQIYQEHLGKIVPDEFDIIPEILFEGEKGTVVQPENSSPALTELGMFLDRIYRFEKVEARPDSERMSLIKTSIDTVNGMPDVEGIRELKTELIEKLKHLQQAGLQQRRYEIIFKDETKPFTTFRIFKTNFIKHARLALEKKGIPTFDFRTNDSPIILITLLAIEITNYFRNKKFSSVELGKLIHLAYSTAEDYKDWFHGAMINKAQSFNRTRGELKEEARRIGIDLKKKLRDQGESLAAANTSVKIYLKGRPEYKDVFMKKKKIKEVDGKIIRKNVKWEPEDWKKFLQYSKSGIIR